VVLKEITELVVNNVRSEDVEMTLVVEKVMLENNHSSKCEESCDAEDEG